MTLAVADAAGIGCEAEDVWRETSVDRLVKLGEYAQEHAGLRVMRVPGRRPMAAAVPMSDQLSCIWSNAWRSEEEPGGAGCDRATWVQKRAGGHILDNF